MAIRAVAGRGKKAAGLKKHCVFIEFLYVREQKGSFHGVFLTLTVRSSVFASKNKLKSFFGRPPGRPSHPQASHEGQKPGQKGSHRTGEGRSRRRDEEKDEGGGGRKKRRQKEEEGGPTENCQTFAPGPARPGFDRLADDSGPASPEPAGGARTTGGPMKVLKVLVFTAF